MALDHLVVTRFRPGGPPGRGPGDAPVSRNPQPTPDPRKPRKVRKVRPGAGPPSTVLDAGRARGKLTARQRLFVREFVAGKPGVRGVAIRAAEAAGYSLRDMGIGAQLVRHPAVRAAIARYFEKWDLKAQDVIDELQRVGFSDMRNFLAWDGERVSLKPSDELTDDDAAAVAEVSKTETEHGGAVRFKLHDKLAALGMLAKLFGVVANRVEHVGRNGGPIELSTYVYLPANGREVDPDQVRAAPAEIASSRRCRRRWCPPRRSSTQPGPPEVQTARRNEASDGHPL